MLRQIALAAAMLLSTPIFAEIDRTGFFEVSVASAHFIRGQNICQKNVNHRRNKMGLKSTGSDAAISVKRLARISKRAARRGDILWTERPGTGTHSALVDGWRGGKLYCLNPSSKLQRWQLKPCDQIWANMPRSYHR